MGWERECRRALVFVFVGGIDADGTFSVGAATEQPGVTLYSRTDGKFVQVNGRPDSADFMALSTDIINMVGINYDCDIDVAGTLRCQGP